MFQQTCRSVLKECDYIYKDYLFTESIYILDINNIAQAEFCATEICSNIGILGKKQKVGKRIWGII